LEVDWASLHKILSDTTRRSILELLVERESLTYTDIMTLLQITNTGRLNYHLKALGNLLSKDEGGRYHLTEQGRQAAGLLRTFPERAPPERKLTAVKVATAIVLIVLGIFIITSFAYLLVFVTGPTTVAMTDRVGLSTEAIPQNTTIYLTGWTSMAPTLSMAWGAASPVHIYVLNQTQFDALQLSHTSGSQAPPSVLYNFTGPPASWVQQYDKQSGNVTLSLPQEMYRFYAWSPTATALDSFGLSQTQTEPGGAPSSLFLYLYALIFFAIGALLIVLAVSILTRRVWT